MADMSDIFGSESENEEQEEQQENEDQEEEEEEEEEEDEAHEEENDEEEQEENEREDEGANEDENKEQEEEEEEQQQQNSDEDHQNDEDEDEDEVVRKKPAKTVDVFGDELADLSDDEEATENEEKEELHHTGSQSHHLINDDEEEAEPEQVISIEVPRVKTDLGKEVHFVKLPNFLSVEPRPFEHDTYEDETPKGETLDEEGKTRVRLKVENTIRWRYEKDNDGNLIKQSNARIVKWSDGSLSMYLGNEIFDVYKTFMLGDHNHLFVRQNNVLHGQTVFRTKLTFRPHSTDSMTHRKMTMSLVDRGAKTKKVKILAEMKKNPEYKRQELMKKEEEKLKAASRRQNQQRRIREKSHSKGLTSNYLEDKYHSEEDEMSLNAIKNKFKSKNADRTAFYSSSDESDKERRLNKSKKHLDDYEEDENDDEDDDNMNRSKKSNSKDKNKKKKKVVSDEDD